MVHLGGGGYCLQGMVGSRTRPWDKVHIQSPGRPLCWLHEHHAQTRPEPPKWLKQSPGHGTPHYSHNTVSGAEPVCLHLGPERRLIVKTNQVHSRL